MPKPDFLKMRCVNNDNEMCATCPRDFVIPVSQLGVIAKNGKGTAVISAYDWNILHPCCGEQLRSIRVLMPFDKFVSLLDGKVEDVGSVEMVYYKDTI